MKWMSKSVLFRVKSTIKSFLNSANKSTTTRELSFRKKISRFRKWEDLVKNSWNTRDCRWMNSEKISWSNLKIQDESFNLNVKPPTSNSNSNCSSRESHQRLSLATTTTNSDSSPSCRFKWNQQSSHFSTPPTNQRRSENFDSRKRQTDSGNEKILRRTTETRENADGWI